MSELGNLLTDIPPEIPAEICRSILAAPGLRIERIISRGQASPEGYWYDQETDEWILIVQGAARLRLEGMDQPIQMTAGSYLNIPAHQRHRVEWTDPFTPTVWLTIHYHASS